MSDEGMLQAAMDHAEKINAVTDPDADPLEVWLTKDGSLTVSIPNELYSYAQAIDEDRDIQICKRCHEPTVLKKDQQGNYQCQECGAKERDTSMQFQETSKDPFKRSLPYATAAIGEVSNVMSTEMGVMPRRLVQRKKPWAKLTRDVENKHQEDVENSANDLAMDD